MLEDRLDRRRFLTLAGASGIALGVSSCGSPLQKLNYEFELHYLAYGQPLVASTVQMMNYRARKGGFDTPNAPWLIASGEAPCVRVPQTGGVIAATFMKIGSVHRSPGRPVHFGGRFISQFWDLADPFMRELLPPTEPAPWPPYDALMALEAPSRWVTLTPDDLPLIVYFPDADDPGCAQWVSQWDDRAAIRVVSARARLVRDRVTRKHVQTFLPWINKLKNPFGLGPVTTRTYVSDRLTKYSLVINK